MVWVWWGAGRDWHFWYIPRMPYPWDAVGKGCWVADVDVAVEAGWGWLVLLSPASLPDTLAFGDPGTPGADTLTSSLTAGRHLGKGGAFGAE